MDITLLGTAPGDRPVHLYRLRGDIDVTVTDFGGAIVTCRVPDARGAMTDVVLGYDTLFGYLADTAYLGSIVGRYANRIAAGRFTLEGREYRLALNNGPNSLHGGDAGFDKAVWGAIPEGERLRLHLSSADGAGGYPGTLDVHVTYAVTGHELRIEYEAHTDATTVVNLTNHAYFNLAGTAGPVLPTILDHELDIRASRYTPVDETLIPTGELAPVEGTPFDFREPTPIGARIDAPDEQLRRAGGYDHNWVLDPELGLRLAATVHHPASGRVLEVWTTQPGLQFYSGNFLDGRIKGKHGVAYGHRTGFCLETQHFPDSPNQPAFPSTVLLPGQVYSEVTVYRFVTR